jgi:hypothetical protein
MRWRISRRHHHHHVQLENVITSTRSSHLPSLPFFFILPSCALTSLSLSEAAERLWDGLVFMPSSIQHLDSTTSKSIQASLLFPTLTSVVLELVNRSLNAKPSSIEVWITLAPEWQITCQYDAAAQKFAPDNQYTDSGLDYLSYLGVVDVQHGQYRHILKVSLQLAYIKNVLKLVKTSACA